MGLRAASGTGGKWADMPQNYMGEMGMGFGIL